MKIEQIGMTMAAATLLFFLILGTTQTAQAQFVHPGGLHTQADFDRMAAKVAANASPWVDSYNKLAYEALAQTWWPWNPVTQIVRGVNPSNYARSQKDALAIYYNALRWRITGDTNFAEKAVQGCDAWSSTMTEGVWGNSNWALASGICGYEFAVAGEALRGYPGWSQTSINNYKNFLQLFAAGPPYGWGNYNFLGAHQQTCDSHYRCNWDACNLASLMAIGVFCDDTNMFNYAVNYIKTGIGNGNLTRAAWYIHNDGTAQWEESGRDQAHTMDGLAWLGVACQVAWNQGVDLYGYDNNRLLRGVEYVAKYNLGNDVPYVFYANCDLIATEIGLGGGGRGGFPPFWDMFYNHYVNVKGLAAPYTAQAAAMLRPDGFYNNPNSPDFLGFTTLTHLLDPIPAGAVPSGLTANVIAHSAHLTWWGSAYATSYNVKRATVSGGPYTTIASVGPGSTYYLDAGLAASTTNYYVISAVTPSGETANSPEAVGTTANIVAPYYRFDETSGMVASDSSGFGWGASLINGPAWVTGAFGNAVNLNGASQYVALPTGVIGGLGDFTIATWVNLSTVSAWTRIFDFGVNTERWMFLTPMAGAGGPVRFAITSAGGNTAASISGTAPLGTGWHHVAVTLTGNGGTGVGILYVDGVPVGTNSAMFHTPGMIGDLVNATNNWIGRSQYADPYLNGSVDDFRIYNGALSAAGISAIMAGNPPPAPPGPPPAPSAPTGLSATVISSSQINLSWTGSSGATSYNLKRATTSGGPYVIVANLLTSLNQTNFNDTGLTDGTTYYYVVTALNDGGQSANSAQVSGTPPVPVLVDHWDFDETSGTTAFDLAGANNGTLAAGATWAAGKINNAVSLDGTSTSYVSFPAGIVSTLTDFSIATWVYVNAHATWARVFDFGNDTTNYMLIAPSSGSGTVRFSITTSSSTGEQGIDSAPNALAPGSWHHLTVTLSGTVGTLYIDGVKAGQNGGMTLNPSSLGSTAQNYIGKSLWGDPNLNGLVDDFRIYSGALSAAEVSALVAAGTPQPPVAPTSLNATAGNAVVNLDWVQSTSSGITTNKVYRSTTGSGGPYSVLATLAATTSYSDTAVVNGSTYYYSVTAINGGGESGYSAYAGATPQPGVPAAPTGLTATPGNAQVALSWNASSGATGYNVKRATTSGGSYTTIGSTTAAGYTDPSAANFTTYYYVVSATNGSGASANSAEASATPPGPQATTLLNISDSTYPTLCSVSNYQSAGVAGLTGSEAISQFAPAYNVALTSPMTFTNGGQVIYMDSTANGGTWAKSTGAGSPNGLMDLYLYTYATTPRTMTVSNLNLIPSTTYTLTVIGKILNNTPAEDGLFTPLNTNPHITYASTSPGQGILTVNFTTSAAYVNTDTLQFTWARYSASGNGVFQGLAIVPIATNSPPPAAPTGLNATAGDAQVALSWTASSGATSYNLKRATVNGGPYTTVTNVTATGFTDTGLVNGTAYYYVVSALNAGGESANSTQASATPQVPPPAAPTGLNATAGDAQVALSWTASSGATSYNVKRATVSGGPYTTVTNVTATGFTDTGLVNGTAYYYVVSAVNAGGESANSTQASATPTGTPPPFVAAGAVASGTATITPALPAGIATGDVLLLFVETANQAVLVSNPNGGTWTEVAGSPQGTGTAAGSSATRLTAFWSRYNGTQGAPTVSDSGNHQLGRMIAIRGAAAAGNPWDVTAGGVEATSDTSASIPGATTTVANTLVVVAVAGSLPDASGTANFSAWTNANLANLTERTDNTVTAGNGGSLGIATGEKVAAGAYGNTAVTHASSAVKGMISIAIKK